MSQYLKTNSSKAFEYNFDGLVGPTHNYAGLSIGNLASLQHKWEVSHPRKAALEGLEKMKFLMDEGFKQALLPPHERPALSFLRKLGLTGSNKKLLESAEKISPALLSACYSASGMWTANSATVSPSADTKDRKTHFTPANLQTFLHRFLEAGQTARVLKKIFCNSAYFTHHPPLPFVSALSDEGAANHSRFCPSYNAEGVELFVYGREGFTPNTKKFYPRQSRLASQAIALRHKIKKTVIARQSPTAVSAGVFHNDVICVADQNLIFYHEKAFADTKKVLREIEKKLSPTPLLQILVRDSEVSLKQCVSSYLFNSQLLPVGKNKWMLLAPMECRLSQVVKAYLQSLTQKGLIQQVHFTPVRQSMRNGGGPACLRLRVALSLEEARAVHPGVVLNPKLYKQLKKWIHKHYRDTLTPKDLKDPLLIQESQTALDELGVLLKLKNIYSFQ